MRKIALLDDHVALAFAGKLKRIFNKKKKKTIWIAITCLSCRLTFTFHLLSSFAIIICKHFTLQFSSLKQLNQNRTKMYYKTDNSIQSVSPTIQDSVHFQSCTFNFFFIVRKSIFPIYMYLRK